MQIKKKLVLKRKIKIFLNKLLLMILLLLIALTAIKKNPNLKKELKTKIYEDSIHFQKIQTIYDKYFGKIFSLKKYNNIESVSSEKLKYQKKEEYQNGLKLTLNENEVISFLESGVIIYIGENENNKTSVIVEQIDGCEAIYSNVNIKNYKLYDYVEKNEILGTVNGNELYLYFKKDGEYLNYQKYI